MKYTGVVALIAVLLAAASPLAADEAPPCVRTSAWAHLLQTRVHDGLVDYAGLTTAGGRAELERVRAEVAACDASALSMIGAPMQKAYWINAYNALTVLVIARHYPIRARGWKAWRYPSSSIRQIDGVWTKIRFAAGGAQRTLDEIEHQILRRQFRDPLVHLGLNCASLGCPPLRREPYDGRRLQEQLRDQLRRYAADPLHGMRIDRDGRTLWLSRIFDWFGEDFAPRALPAHRLKADLDEQLRGVIALLLDVVGPSEREWLRTADFDVAWLDYDWSLNEARK